MKKVFKIAIYILGLVAAFIAGLIKCFTALNKFDEHFMYSFKNAIINKITALLFGRDAYAKVSYRYRYKPSYQSYQNYYWEKKEADCEEEQFTHEE